jgi:hypothetical protein
VPAEKACSRCGLTKNTSEFHRRARSIDGLQAWCKACSHKAVSEFQKREGKSIVHRAAKYGLTRPEVRCFLQIPVCQACGAELTDSYAMKFDHCHEAGHFRGVLCHPCNMACQGTSPAAVERLNKCIDYLVRDMERASEQA